MFCATDEISHRLQQSARCLSSNEDEEGPRELLQEVRKKDRKIRNEKEQEVLGVTKR